MLNKTFFREKYFSLSVCTVNIYGDALNCVGTCMYMCFCTRGERRGRFVRQLRQMGPAYEWRLKIRGHLPDDIAKFLKKASQTCFAKDTERIIKVTR